MGIFINLKTVKGTKRQTSVKAITGQTFVVPGIIDPQETDTEAAVLALLAAPEANADGKGVKVKNPKSAGGIVESAVSSANVHPLVLREALLGMRAAVDAGGASQDERHEERVKSAPPVKASANGKVAVSA